MEKERTGAQTGENKKSNVHDVPSEVSLCITPELHEILVFCSD